MKNYKKKFLVFLLLYLMSSCSSLPSFPSSAQFNNENKTFNNSDGSQNNKNFKDFIFLLKEYINRPFDIREKSGFKILNNNEKKKVEKKTIRWIGHSTLLLEYENIRILTDPVFSYRASPFSFLGPKRLAKPGIEITDLPKIDIILISHNHYDHLDIKSLKKINRIQKNIYYFVPLGLMNLLKKNGIKNVYELDWWESRKYKNISVTSTPAHHWSARSLFDRNKTLWCGWMVKIKNFRFYFMGDSGYSNDFKEIKKKLGSPNLSAIPIGSYAPREFMKYSHINPNEAIKIFNDLNTEKAIAIHWGTFKLSTEPLDEPPREIKKLLKLNKIDEERFLILKHGEVKKLN